jgi:hypothetical protein
MPIFSVKDEKYPKQYIKREKSTFDDKILKPWTNFPQFIGKKTSSDRLKLIYKTKKKIMSRVKPLCMGG